MTESWSATEDNGASERPKRRWWRLWRRAEREPQILYDEYGTPYSSLDAAPLSPAEAEQLEVEERRFIRRQWIVRGAAAALFLLFLTFVWLLFTAPLSKSLQPIAPPQITLTASDGTPIARNGAVVGQPVQVAALPDHVTQTFLAIEDRRFYDHWGIDPRGLARATWNNMTGGPTQGGSTITQQLAKMSFLDAERSLWRKLRELLIAFWLEAWLSKDEILARYLSNAYFGDNVYGLRAASLHYFYRKPENLKPEQAIMLAGLVQAPSAYAPTKHWQRAVDRAAVVRGAMVDAGYLTEAEAAALPAVRLDVRAKDYLPRGTYFADWALAQIRDDRNYGYDEQQLQTTLDLRMQKAAERAIASAGLGQAQAALVAMRPNGEVVAMVGGKDYRATPFNRATQARRQPGSTFKLFVWLAALEAGIDPEDMVNDRPFETGGYRPQNAGERYRGDISLEEAFIHSSNVVSVRLLQELGSKAVIEQARALGVRSPLPESDPSLALGTATMTLLELTAAYAGVAANHFPVKPHAFAEPEPGWFDWLFSDRDSLSGRTHRNIQKLLRGAVNRGTGRAAALSIPNFGKTGTSQKNRDALFVGYAGGLVVGVWIGNDDNSPLAGSISGGGKPARIWREFMATAVPGAVRARPKPRPEPEPVPEDGDDLILNEEGLAIDIGEGSNIRIGRDGDASLSTEIRGIPVDIGSDGVSVDGEPVIRRREEEN